MTEGEWLLARDLARSQSEQWQEALEAYSNGGRAMLEKGIREHLANAGIPLLKRLIECHMGPNWGNQWIDQFVSNLAIEMEKMSWPEDDPGSLKVG